jgi:hypothetical protein
MKKRVGASLIPGVSTRRDQAITLTNAQRNLPVTTQTRTNPSHGDGAVIAAIGIAALAVATAAVVAIVAFGGAGKDGGDSGIVVPPPSASPSAPATPTTWPTTAPSPTSRPSPTPGGGDDGTPIRVRIATVNHAAVTVDVVDETSRVLDARSGPPIEGVSVDTDRVQVENVDATTLRLTWSDYPMDNALTLFVSEGDGRVRLVLVRPGPSETTDAMAFDRQLILRFANPIDASDVDPFVQDGLDTAG